MAKKDLANSFLKQMQGSTKTEVGAEPPKVESKKEPSKAAKKTKSTAQPGGLLEKLVPVAKKTREMYPIYLDEDEHANLMQAAVELGLTRKKKGEDKQVGNLSAVIQYIAKNLN
ncbi:TPA: hypothetical protein ACWWCX_002397 [Enterococcus faecium]